MHVQLLLEDLQSEIRPLLESEGRGPGAAGGRQVSDWVVIN